MKNYFKSVIICILSVLSLTGCGGGGGGGPVTTAATKVTLFGNMTTSGKFNNISTAWRVASLNTSITVPTGIMVNYSSVPNASTGLCASRSLAGPGQCILRDNVIVPSGPVLLSASDVTGTYDIASRVMTVSLLNSGRKPLKSSSNGNAGKGEEVVTINFRLTTAGVTPSLMPVQDMSPVVGQEREVLTHPSSQIDTYFVNGRIVNFVTSYH